MADLDSQQSLGEKMEFLLKLLEQGERKLQLDQKNVTVVLGDTGSGKTVFTKWITNNDVKLESKTDPISLGEYNIIDSTPQVVQNRFTSDTKLPQLMINNNTGEAFYDFPGFSSTRGVAHDIATTYFIKKLVDKVSNVKIVFLLHYASLINDSFEDYFKDLTRNAMNLMRNFENFKDSVILIVSKVNADKNKYSYQMIVNSLVISIKRTRADLQNEMDRRKVDNLRPIQFLDAILRQNGDVYPFIQLFRSPDNEGKLSEISLMLDNKRNVVAALEKLNYATKKESDFDYFVPEQSLVDVGYLLDEVHRHVLANIKSYGQQVQRYLHDIQNEVYDIVQLYDETTSEYSKFTEWQVMARKLDEPLECVQKILDNGIFPDNGTTPASLTEAVKYAKFSSFLFLVSKYPRGEPFKCADGMNDVVNYLDKSRKWYRFLQNLYNNVLSTYDAYVEQTGSAKQRCNRLAKYIIEGGLTNVNKSSNELESMVEQCYPSGDYDYSDIIMDEPKLKALTNVLNMTMNHKVEYSCNGERLLIKGQYVKVSDIGKYERICGTTTPKYIVVFAGHKLFIDTDLRKQGVRQLSFLAETWRLDDILKIELYGENGAPPPSLKAANGYISYYPIMGALIKIPLLNFTRGEDGIPGKPGNPGGHFFGIADTFDKFDIVRYSHRQNKLLVSSIGGLGGIGQHGGDGERGPNGQDAYDDLDINDYCPKPSNHNILHSECTRELGTTPYEGYILEGREGGAGGYGGNGGVGGLGGFPGTITFIPVSRSNTIQFESTTKEGIQGEPGKGGFGRWDGFRGRNVKVEVFNKAIFKQNTKNSSIIGELPTDPTGLYRNESRNGKDNLNRTGLQQPTKPEPFMNRSIIVNEFKEFLRESMYHSVRESQMKEFLHRIENSKSAENPPPKQDNKAFIRDDDDIGPNSETKTITDNSVRDLTAEKTNISVSAAHILNSPINTVMNFVADFFIPLKFIYPSLVTTYKSIKNSIESTFEDSTSSQLNAYYDKCDVNGAIVLVDFLIRRFTKVKPYINIEINASRSEVRANALDMITEFETILGHLIDELELPRPSLDFDPVSLICKLEEKLINEDYRNLAKVLFQSVDGNARLDYADFENKIQPKIAQILTSRTENKLRDCRISVSDKNWNMEQIHVDAVGVLNFDSIFHNPRLQENYSRCSK